MDQDTTIKYSFLKEALFSRNLKKILDDIYCEHISVSSCTTDDYLASFNDSLLLNGCSIEAGPSSYLKHFCDLMRRCTYSQNSC